MKGKCLCLDHTLGSAKYVRTADGRQAYKCILTLYNEHGLVLGQYFTHTTFILQVKEALLLIAARYEEGDGPEVCLCRYHSIHKKLFVLLVFAIT